MTPSQADRWRKNREHWNAVANTRNISTQEELLNWETERQLYRSIDFVYALRQLEPLRGMWLMDLGGGVGLSAQEFLERGARVVIVDISLERCKKARRQLLESGFDGRVECVVAEAQALPFVSECFDRLFTKSVLIHTPIAEASKELARVIHPTGRAAFIEPMRRNPFVNLYRRLQAPGIWKEITTYFSPREFQVVGRAFQAQKPFRIGFSRWYFLGFFGFVFSFAVTNTVLFRFFQALLQGVDKFLLGMFPPLKNLCWFGVLTVSPRTRGKSASIRGRSLPK